MSEGKKRLKNQTSLSPFNNPKWREIQEKLFENQSAYDRPEFMARIFKLKLKALTEDLYKNGILGREVTHVHVVVFQRRGLPHAHMLVIFYGEDAVRTTMLLMTLFVLKFQIKTRINVSLTLSSITRSTIIRKHVSKAVKCVPNIFQDGYPSYRRRSSQDGGRHVSVIDGKKAYTITNADIAPYNLGLLLKYDAQLFDR